MDMILLEYHEILFTFVRVMETSAYHLKMNKTECLTHANCLQKLMIVRGNYRVMSNYRVKGRVCLCVCVCLSLLIFTTFTQ